MVRYKYGFIRAVNPILERLDFKEQISENDTESKKHFQAQI